MRLISHRISIQQNSILRNFIFICEYIDMLQFCNKLGSAITRIRILREVEYIIIEKRLGKLILHAIDY